MAIGSITAATLCRSWRTVTDPTIMSPSLGLRALHADSLQTLHEEAYFALSLSRTTMIQFLK